MISKIKNGILSCKNFIVRLITSKILQSIAIIYLLVTHFITMFGDGDDFHSHNYADSYHSHSYADSYHSHSYADSYHSHSYAEENHDHDYGYSSYAKKNHSHSAFEIIGIEDHKHDYRDLRGVAKKRHYHY